MSEPRILVTGSRGQLGAALCRRLGTAAVGLSRDDLDFDRLESIAERIEPLAPTAIVHCAAYTQVDAAESHSQLCFRVNAEAVAVLAEFCTRRDIPLVQISTDYVFHGEPDRQAPFSEGDSPNPRSVYARSKLAGEAAARSCPRALIVRTCGLYGQGGQNFVETMLRLGSQRDRLRVVGDQRCTPSSVEDVSRAIEYLLSRQATGILHVVNQGSTTWCQFAREIFRLAGMNVAVDEITAAEYGAAAPRPSYSVLDTRRYAALEGPALPDWQTALSCYLAGRSPASPSAAN